MANVTEDGGHHALHANLVDSDNKQEPKHSEVQHKPSVLLLSVNHELGVQGSTHAYY